MAINTTYIIYNTAGQPVTAIQPNTLNGPGGVQQSSDLRMYGLGFTNWGEGVNENDYRVVENFACPDMTEFPLSPRYTGAPVFGDPNVAARTPASQTELGEGNGINAPIPGQLWFNSTRQEMYVYKNTQVFESIVGTPVNVGPTPPVSPVQGTLWYDPSIPQLMVYDGGWNSVASRYVPLSGGTMSGNLNMNGNRVMGIPNSPAASTDAVNANYVTNAIAGVGSIYVNTTGDTMTGALNMSSAAINVTNSSVNITGGSLNISGSNPAISAGGGRISGVAAPSVGTDAVNRDFVSSTYLARAGGTMSGVLGMAGYSIDMGNARIVNVGTPIASGDAVNKGYVDSSVYPKMGLWSWTVTSSTSNTRNAWTTYPITTTVYNNIGGTLNSNLIVLPPGTYMIDAVLSFYQPGSCGVRLCRTFSPGPAPTAYYYGMEGFNRGSDGRNTIAYTVTNVVTSPSLEIVVWFEYYNTEGSLFDNNIGTPATPARVLITKIG